MENNAFMTDEDSEETPSEGVFNADSSIDSIVDNFLDATATPSPATQSYQPPSEPPFKLPDSNPQALLSDIQNLEQELEDAKLEGKTPESIRSFEGLKARYKNTISSIKDKVALLEREKNDALEKIAVLPDIQAKANYYETATTKMKRLEEDLEKSKKEAQDNSYFRKKYDLENDPEIKRSFLLPMQELKKRCNDIISNVGLDEQVWHDLMTADSEFKINHIIDAADISGLNAQSLKNYVYQYKDIATEFRRASDPSYIEATIEAAQGKNKKLSEELSEQAFTSIKDAFSKHVRELEYSEVNKEHNLFVHDKVVEKAKATFEVLKKALAPEYHNPQALASVAQASIMASAYPHQKKLVDFLMEDREKLIKEIRSLTSGPSINQSQERRSNGFADDFDLMTGKGGDMSIDEITSELFR